MEIFLSDNKTNSENKVKKLSSILLENFNDLNETIERLLKYEKLFGNTITLCNKDFIISQRNILKAILENNKELFFSEIKIDNCTSDEKNKILNEVRLSLYKDAEKFNL